MFGEKNRLYFSRNAKDEDFENVWQSEAGQKSLNLLLQL